MNSVPVKQEDIQVDTIDVCSNGIELVATVAQGQKFVAPLAQGLELGQHQYSKICKLTIALLVGALMMLFKIFLIPTLSVDCILDRSHVALEGVNILLNNNSDFAYMMIIIASMFIDFLSVVTVLHWLLKSNSLRLPIVILLFYLVRLPHLYLFTAKFPEGMLMPYPHFPSLTVPYGRQSDFFFSGHCGILTLFLCEWISLGNSKMVMINIIGLIYTAFICLALRIHYIIDITAGIMIGHYIVMIVEKYQPPINKLASKMEIEFSNYLIQKFYNQKKTELDKSEQI